MTSEHSLAKRAVQVAPPEPRSRDRVRELAEAVDQAAEGVMICDADGIILEVNKAFSRITGFDAAEALGKHPLNLFWEHHDEAHALGIESALRSDGRWKGEGRARRKDGAIYLESRSISVVRDDAGSFVRRVTLFYDVTHEKENERRLAFMAHHDELTGLPNRALFLHECGEAIARAQRRRAKVALMYIDLDDFKIVNDTHGHAAGDAVLKGVAPRVQDCVRKTDTVARLGGDEFTVVIDDVQDERDVAVIARKILERLAEPFSFAGHELRVSASIGIACYPDDTSDMGTLLENADTAMYAAKEQGGANFQYFSPDLNARALEALLMANNLRLAVAREEFCLVYQPRVELSSLRITGVEALIRWNHPQLGLILPSQFMAVAEKTGIIEELGGWVLRHACRQMAAWQQSGSAPPRLAINLSARQFNQPGLVETVASALTDAQLDAEALELEVTESIVMEHPLESAVTLRRLKALGVSIAIDDFGTGYSSLNHLQRFQVDYIKIDQSFVRGIPLEADEVRVTDAIMAIARTLGVKLIAEGIETPQQLEYLRHARCEEGQGYLFSRPVAEPELKALLKVGRLHACRGVSQRLTPYTLAAVS